MVTFRKVPTSIELTALLKAGSPDLARLFAEPLPALLVKHGGGNFVPEKRMTARRGMEGKRLTDCLVLTETFLRKITDLGDLWIERTPFTGFPCEGELPADSMPSVRHPSFFLKTQEGRRLQSAMENTPHQLRAKALESYRWPVSDTIISKCKAAYVVHEPMAATILGAASQYPTGTPLTFPLFADFRGRLYPETGHWSYQGGDLGKTLMRGPGSYSVRSYLDGLTPEDRLKVRRMQVSSCRGIMAGSSEKHKLPLNPELWMTQRGWEQEDASNENLYQIAAWSPEDPGQLYQMDGTCNGIQHLAALSLSLETGARVNLTYRDPSTLGPADVYGEVAKAVEAKVRATNEPWALRFKAAASFKITRSMVKELVMTLPYGAKQFSATNRLGATYRDALAGVCEVNAPVWQNHMFKELEAQKEDGGDKNYDAFAERELKDHPLFAADCRAMASITWAETLQGALGSAGEVMGLLQSIAAECPGGSISWRIGPGDMWVEGGRPSPEDMAHVDKALFVYRTQSKDIKTQKKGHQKDALLSRSYLINAIVPHFVHSQDARHMSLVGERVLAAGHPFFGVHDCFFTDATGLLCAAKATREVFVEMYRDPRNNPLHPLNQEVRVAYPEAYPGDMPEEVYPSWHALAEAKLGDGEAFFRIMGDLRIEDVLDSYYFFC
jgi:hypothetical protein